MATNTFKREISRNIGAVLTAIGGYTPGGGVTTIVTGLILTNTLAKGITVDVSFNDGANDYYMRKGHPLAAGESEPIIGSDRLVMVAGDSIKVLSSDATSVDAVMSILERS